MAIYRGSGGAGDAVADTSNQSASAVASAAAAASSAAAASTSATNAASSATAASNSATAAASSSSSASSSASSASSSASSASSSASAAASSASAAQTAETNAETAKTNAETAQAAAEAAQAAAESAQAAAETAETNAETAETNAETAATNAASSASTASTAATNASNSASAASTSASNASTSATNASNSAAAAASSASAASTSETNAASSASAASTSASNAATSATNASNSATAASGSATAAASSASSAASSASAASASADAALAALDNFDDRYLGQKTSDPTLDNDGNALIAGALYFNTTDDAMKVYDGAQWLAAYASLSGALIASNNLSDLSSVSTARTNLGLATVAATGAYSDLSGKPTNVSTFTNDAGYLTTETYLGTVTSVDLSVPTGLSVSGNPVTSSGTLAISYSAGYAIPTTVKQSNWDDAYTFVGNFPTQTGNSGKYLTTNGSALSWGTLNTSNWDTAYSWGNHASAGYQAAATALTTSTSFGGDVSGTYNAIVVSDDSHNHIISNIDGLQTALDNKADLASPALTGTPTAPTATTGTNTTQIATTAFVNAEIANDAPSKTGTGASGTWGISISGNAATATSATSATSATTAAGLTGTPNITVGTILGGNTQLSSLGVGTAASGTSGEIRATNNITAYYSDDRLKTKLGNIENALDKVCSLSGFYYEANETAKALGYESVREVGVSAQQVQAIMPEVVVPAPIDDQYLTVRYERLMPLLIEAIKELRAEIKALKGE